MTGASSLVRGRFLSAFRWLVAAGWSLLLCDCWLVTRSGTLFEPQEGLWRALGGLWDGHGMARAGARMGHEAQGGDGQPVSDLDLRFPMFWEQIELTFSTDSGPSDALA